MFSGLAPIMTPNHFVVNPADAPVRVDVFLRSRLGGVSRSYIQRAIDEGRVLIGSRRCAKGDVLSPGDEVRLEGFVRPEERRVAPNPALDVPVLFQDDDLLVLDKPAGMPVHPNDFDDTGTVVNFLLARYPEVEGVGEGALRPGIVHRLDTGTTGLLLVARSTSGYSGLKQQFVTRTIRKHYFALVLGHLAAGGRIEVPLAHDPKNVRKMKVFSHPADIEKHHAREALTDYEIWQQFGGSTLVWVSIKTGRMHQIRAHFAHLGHALAGDPLYQTAAQQATDRVGLDRPGLHAARLKLAHPTQGRSLLFESPLAPDLAAAIARLSSSS